MLTNMFFFLCYSYANSLYYEYNASIAVDYDKSLRSSWYEFRNGPLIFKKQVSCKFRYIYLCFFHALYWLIMLGFATVAIYQTHDHPQFSVGTFIVLYPLIISLGASNVLCSYVCHALKNIDDDNPKHTLLAPERYLKINQLFGGWCVFSSMIACLLVIPPG